MPIERYFIHSSFSPHSHTTLSGNEFHHLAHVMRNRKGDLIELVNGQGALAKASVQEILKDKAHLLIEEVQTSDPRPMRVILAQAFPKLNRLDFILEKGTELGVDEFWLFPGQRSLKKDLSAHQIERMQALIVSAMKQSGRLYLPQLVIKNKLETWTELQGTLFFGDVEPDAPPFAVKWDQTSLLSPIIFFVGPESGLNQEEIDYLKEKNAQGVKLNQNILRTDTAPLAALSLIEQWLLV